MYLARTSLTSSDPGAKIYAQSLEGGAPTLLLASQTRAIAVPDYLLFARNQNLFAQRMDWKAVRKVGEPLLLARNVAASPAYLSRPLRKSNRKMRTRIAEPGRGLFLRNATARGMTEERDLSQLLVSFWRD